MLGPYRSVLAEPGALRFSSAGLLARLEIAILPLGLLLLVQSDTGSYAIGGAIAGTHGVAGAVVAPLIARLVDRRGQAAVLRVAILAHTVLLVSLVVVAVLRAPLPVLFLLAAASGSTQVSVGSLVRARWAVLLGGTARLQTAFAIESVIDDLVFVVGPAVVTLLATLVSPAAGPLLAAASALVGGLLLAAQRSTQPPVAADAGRGGSGAPSALRTRGVLVLVLVFLCAGGLFAGSEVSVVALTRSAGVPALAGLVLSLWSIGSMVSGLAYGAVGWRSRPDHRFVLLTLLLALSTLLMAGAPVLLLPAVFLVAGVAIAPVVTTGATLVESLVPPSRLTEGLASTSTALNLTYALGNAVAGVVVDAAGARAGFAVPVLCGAAAAAAVLLGARRLRPAGMLERTPGPEPAD